MSGLADALRAEHAAIFGYGIVGARLSGGSVSAAKRAETAHRKRRDALLERLSGRKQTPPAAEPAYPLPFEVSDGDGALKLAVHLEERTAGVWRAAISATKGKDRQLAVEALIDCAIRASRWRTAAGTDATVALPGIDQ
jgi:hypothetical protein